MIYITDKGIFRLIEGGTLICVLKKAVECGCGRMAMMVINRMGQTRCTECDHEFQKSEAQRGR